MDKVCSNISVYKSLVRNSNMIVDHQVTAIGLCADKLSKSGVSYRSHKYEVLRKSQNSLSCSMPNKVIIWSTKQHLSDIKLLITPQKIWQTMMLLHFDQLTSNCENPFTKLMTTYVTMDLKSPQNYIHHIYDISMVYKPISLPKSVNLETL